MPIQKLRPSFTFTEDRLRELQAVVPEAFADGKVNWETLREALGNYLEDDEQGAEHFGLFWPGKREARRLAAKPSKGTLLPAPGEGVNEDSTRNVFIEGDNLEVLKLLQKSYASRVKMIYIDPPYNTGNDFVYRDDFKDPLEDYLLKTGQASDGGEMVTSNPVEGGRFHSNWLSMIYPRLVLARQLLREDGVIFISIDYHEAHHLRSVMNEIFGEENFVADIAWQRKYSVSNNSKGFAPLKESILIYARSVSFESGLLPRSDESKARYVNPDNDPRGPWKPVDYWNQASPERRPNLVYPITNPHTKAIILPEKKAWKFAREVHMRHVTENRIWWGMDGKNSVPALKLFLSDVRDGLIPHDWWPHEEAGHTDEAKKELDRLFGEAPFDTPKPTRLLKRILRVANLQSGDIVLDFFAGSCTTAHAVFDFGQEESRNLCFVMVQIPEPTPEDSPAHKNGYADIAKIGKERIRRVIKELQAEAKSKMPIAHGMDIGFKVFQLVRSNYRAWQDYSGDFVEELESLFDSAETPLVDGWTPEGLLTEILLLEGFPLDSAVSEQTEIKHNKVWLVESDACAHRLWACFDARVKEATIENLTLNSEDIFICLDSALTDEAKVRLSDLGNVHTI